MKLRLAALAFAGLLAACAATPAAKSGPGFTYYVTGNPADVQKPTRGLWVAQGGGDDVDANYARMGEYGGGGDFVVLRASGKGEYNDYIFSLCRCDSVETFVFDQGVATSDAFVIERIRNAEAVFIAGGDQSNYIRYWKDTPVEDAINFVAAKPAPIGGTSAGMAVLGEYVYSAEGKESLTSPAALADPYAPDLTLARGFLALPRLENVITDQHLQERDRIGRTIALLSRLQADGWSAQAARDRGRPRNGAAHRSRDRHGRSFCDSGPSDALRVLHGAGRAAFAVQNRRAAHDAAPLPCIGSVPAAASILRIGAGKTALRTSCASTPASYIRRAGATTEPLRWQT